MTPGVCCIEPSDASFDLLQQLVVSDDCLGDGCLTRLVPLCALFSQFFVKNRSYIGAFSSIA